MSSASAKTSAVGVIVSMTSNAIDVRRRAAAKNLPQWTELDFRSQGLRWAKALPDLRDDSPAFRWANALPAWMLLGLKALPAYIECDVVDSVPGIGEDDEDPTKSPNAVRPRDEIATDE